ncbi:LacI family DNA-binding transcriptional regulator [Pedobacter heparinus]|uniref:LacI family DNA-binding transcriptional regulator n=1 Tax=Pedobacter heparinus TaxID=984 RepID=UPI00292D261A|nr:substrate-binding domain-containing protein [Pedobacter heparinus]
MKRKVSMKDIAQKLGVSTALVSYVLNNQLEDRINKETAEKIRQLAEALNYQPNHIAKSLKNNKTNTIGLIVADISNPFSANIARIIEDEAKKSKYTVIFGSADESYKKSQDLINVLLSRQVDGFIIAPAENSEKQLLLLKKQGVPFVLIDRYFPELDVDRVILNNYKAAYDAVTHLISNGYRRIGMINFNTGLFHLQERVRGYKEALAQFKAEDLDENFRTVDEKAIKTEVKLRIDELLNKSEAIDALFFGSNNLAIEGLAYLQSLKIKVPDELAIVCFDEDNAYNLFHCPLSYVKQPLYEIGRTSVEMLLKAIAEGSKNTNVVLDAALMIHESSMAVPEIS